jgi:predicted Zn finger-like uncharacterized protein
MYTQCEQCKAIFRVNMREVTVAKGQLRCGECNSIFNATKSLSTTIPASYQDLEANKESPTANIHKSIAEHHDASRVIHTSPFTVKESPSAKKASIKKQTKSKEPTSWDKYWPILAALLLVTLLITQVVINKRYLFLGIPLHEPEKIQMLNHNIFAHPNELGVLLISAQIENTAKKAQPYPVLELSLKNSQSKLVAFRRFLPKEYLTNYSKDQLIPPNIPITLKLKIKDPGSKATHFQFEFL